MTAGQPETGVKPPEQTMNPTAAGLQADLVAMVEAQQAEGMPAEQATESTEPANEQTMGRAEAKGAAIGRKIDNLAERGSDAVAAGRDKVSDGLDRAADRAYEAAGKIDDGIKGIKERAKNVRERVKGGAELVGEKRKEAVAAAKDKSKKAMLVTIGASIAAGEAIASAPEKVAAKGRKIGETLNRWASKAMEKISGRAKKTKETISGAILDAAEKVGDVVESGIDKVDDRLKNWEVKLQAARKEAEAAAEQARLDSLKQSYIEARVEGTTKEANAEYDDAVSRAEKNRKEKITAAETSAATEVDGMSAEQLEDAIKQLLEAPEPEAVAKPAETPPATAAPEAAPEVMPVAA